MEQIDEISPDEVFQHLAAIGCSDVSASEARDLVPLVRAQRTALARLRGFDVANLRTPIRFDPRDGYAR